ncbi:MAG: hypothetical protein WC107_03485 [Patescibacteria group bacterium]
MKEKKAPDIKEIMADYDKAVEFLANTPAEVWENIGTKTALSVFEDTTENIPAYKRFLQNEKFDPKQIKTMDSFFEIPVSDKYNYVQPFGFNEINSVQAGKNLYSFSLSSGTADDPTIWPRYIQYEDFLPSVFDVFMRQYWNIDKKSSLVLNAFAMGPWIAGFCVHQALRPLTQKYKLTMGTTGADIESIIYAISKISQYYDQTIIMSYPTFARTILDRLEQTGINIKKLNLKMFIAGEGHTVEWRQYINKMTSGNKNDLISIIDGYGVTDTGLAGQGSALTNLIRDLAFKDEKLSKSLFGEANSVPSLFQYNPGNYFIEEYNGEILFTTKATTPLIRYNIHDRGGIIKFREMESILANHGYDYKRLIKKAGLPLSIISQQPFVYCFGRRDDTIIIGGANIFPEQIAPALFNEKVKDIHSFKLTTKFDKKQHQLSYAILELKSGITYKKNQLVRLKNKYHNTILNRLLKTSSDYAVSYKADPKYADIIIEIFENGQGPFASDSSRTKPRLILKK